MREPPSLPFLSPRAAGGGQPGAPHSLPGCSSPPGPAARRLFQTEVQQQRGTASQATASFACLAHMSLSAFPRDQDRQDLIWENLYRRVSYSYPDPILKSHRALSSAAGLTRQKSRIRVTAVSSFMKALILDWKKVKTVHMEKASQPSDRAMLA